MAVHFKFKSARDFDKVSIEGPFITVSSLKDKIIEAKNLGKAADFDLVLTNSDTGEEYSDDSFLVPKNTSVTVRRVPAKRPRATLQAVRKAESGGANAVDHQSSEDKIDGGAQVDDFGAELVSQSGAHQANADEELKLKAAVLETAADWQQQNQQVPGRGGRGFGRGGFAGRSAGGRGSSYPPRGPPPVGYVCHRCGIKGHWIQDCPTNGDPNHDNKRAIPKAPVGIPKSMLASVADGSYVLPNGEMAVLRPDESEFAKHAARLQSHRPQVRAIPPDYQCSLCGNLFRDAVMVPCCYTSFCDQCIREELMKNGKCPNCGATHITNDDLLPNLSLRKTIERFKSEQAATATRSSAGDRAAGLDVSVVQSAPKSPSPLSRPAEDLQTRNSSGAESSAHISGAEIQEKAGALLKKDGALSGRGTGGVEVGTEADKAHERARSPLYESEHQRPHITGGPPLHKEMADGMVARAGDWSDMSGGAGGLPYGGVAVNKARMKELQEQHRCLICGSPDHLAPKCPEHPMPDFPSNMVPNQFEQPFRAPGPGPYPPDYYQPRPNDYFPGPHSFPPRPFGGPPAGPIYPPDGMMFDGPMGQPWLPRGGPFPYGGPGPIPPQGPGFDGFPRGPGVRPPLPVLSREEFQRRQEEKRRELEAKKRSQREDSSDISERSHKHKKREKDDRKHRKSRKDKESRHGSEERSKGEGESEDGLGERSAKRGQRYIESGSNKRYDEEETRERPRSGTEDWRREKIPSAEDVGRKSSSRSGLRRQYSDDHWTPDGYDTFRQSEKYDARRPASARHQDSSKREVFSRLRYVETDDMEKRARLERVHRSESPAVNDGRSREREFDGRYVYERENAKRRRTDWKEPTIEDDDRWIA